MTILFISHDRTFVGALAKKILEVKNGTIKLFGGSFEVYMDYLKSAAATDEAGSEPVQEPKKNPESTTRKRAVSDDNLLAKKELRKIENQLTELKKEERKIIKKFEKNPTKIDLDLNKKLKEAQSQLRNLKGSG